MIAELKIPSQYGITILDWIKLEKEVEEGSETTV